MVKCGLFSSSCCLLTLVSVEIALCQYQEFDARVNQYYALLIKQPGSVQLFNRFYDAWLDTSTPEALGQYLNDQLAGNRSVSNYLILASFLERRGKHLESSRLYREAAERAPENAEVLYLKAQAELRAHDLDRAISDLEKAPLLQMSWDLTEKCAKLLGKLYVRTAQTEKAQALWQQLLEDNPQDEDLYEDLIELQLAEGLYELAVETSDQLLAITKDSYETVMRRLRRGDILQYSGKNEEALAEYASCLSLVGHGTWLEDQITAQIERVFLREDNLPGLRDFYAELIQADAQRVELKKRLARFLLQLKQHEEALALYKEILSVTPGDKTNQQAYVAALAEAQKLGKAIDLLTQMSRQYPQDRELLIQLAELYHRNNQDKQAGDALQSFISQSEKTEYLFLRVGRILERYTLHEQADRVYQELAKAWPNSPSAKEAYAQFLFRIKKTEDALALWQEIARSGDVQMLVRAAQAVSLHGHGELALQWLEPQYNDYSDNVTYLMTLCQMGLGSQHYVKTLTWARRQLEIATDFTQIKAAVVQVVAVAKRGNRTAALINELAARESRSIQQVCLLAELYESVLMRTEADMLLDEASDENQKTILKQQIRLCRQRRDWSLAAEKTQTLLAQTGTRDSHYVRELVELYRKANEYEKALEWIPAWKKSSPANVQPWLSEAQLLADLGQEDEAIRVLRRADQKFESREEILTHLAALYARSNLSGDVQRIYWRLYETSDEISDKIRWIRDMGHAAQAEGSHEGIIEKLKERKRNNPSSILPCLALAEMYRQMHRYEERRQVLFEATRIQSNDPGLLHEIARIEEQEGDWEQALDTLERALPLDSTAKTRQKMANIHIQYRGKEAGYRMLFGLAGGRDVTAQDAQAMVSAMAPNQNWAMVIHLLEGILDHHPRNYKLHYLYAVALEEDGRNIMALEAYLRLLSMTKEIPGNTEKPIPSPWAQAGFNLTELLPVEAMVLMEMRTLRSAAYEHRRNRSLKIFSGTNARRPPTVPVRLPPTIDDLSGFALCHIFSLSQFMDEEGQRRIRASVESAGVDNAEILMSLSTLSMGDVFRPFQTLVTRYPNDRAVQAAWMINRLSYPTTDGDQFKRVFSLFSDDLPRLACLAGLHYGAIDGSDPNILDRSLAILDSTLDGGFSEILGVTSIFEKPTLSKGVSTKVLAVLGAKLRHWFAAVQTSRSNRQYLFPRVAYFLAQNEDLTEFVKFLDREAWSDTGGFNPAGQTAWNRRHSNRLINLTGQVVWIRRPSILPLIKPLAYPPTELPGFPTCVLQLLFPGPPSPYVARPERVLLDHEALVSHLDITSHSILKVLMLIAAEKQAKAQELLNVLTAAQPASLTALVLAATLAAKMEDLQTALALLEKARFLPMDPNHRKTLDAAMVAYAIELDPTKSAADVILGQKAALRLRGNRMSQHERTELAGAMETLGMTMEAAKLAE